MIGQLFMILTITICTIGLHRTNTKCAARKVDETYPYWAKYIGLSDNIPIRFVFNFAVCVALLSITAYYL